MLSSDAPYGVGYQAHSSDIVLSPTMSRSARRGPWLPDEDQTLLQLVRTQGANNWVRISQQIQHRSPKQCRERYHQNLKPSLKHDPISHHEGELIERLVQEMGKRWAEIARRLGNRSDNAVKNWWNGSVNRRRRNPAHVTTTGSKQVGSRLQPVPFTQSAERRYNQRSQATSTSTSNHNTNPYKQSREDVTPYQPTLTQIPTPLHTPATSAIEPSPSNVLLEPFTRNPPRHNTLEMSAAPNTRPTLSIAYTSDPHTRLPPLRANSLHLPPIERRVLPTEHGPISPALSDTSQRHVPSLVSDSQSLYSISPRTVTTPRAGLVFPTETGHPVWADHQSTVTSTGYLMPARSTHHSEVYFRHHPTHISYHPGVQQVPTPGYSVDRSKDSRMNVSTLLG